MTATARASFFLFLYLKHVEVSRKPQPPEIWPVINKKPSPESRSGRIQPAGRTQKRKETTADGHRRISVRHHLNDVCCIRDDWTENLQPLSIEPPADAAGAGKKKRKKRGPQTSKERGG